MSDTRPIGIFDSGLGGLTVAKEINALLPHESTIYIGDTARVPYGNRSPETVTHFSSQMVQFLINQDVKTIVIACATASSVALESLQKQFPSLPIIGVIEPAAKDAASRASEEIAIIGTRATIQSQSLEKQILSLSSATTAIRAIACPLFVPLIEEGITSGPILETVIDHYLQPFIAHPPKVLVLGCTHYPLITTTLQTHLPHTQLINVGVSAAKVLQTVLLENHLTSSETEVHHEYFATDVTDNFRQTTSLFLGSVPTIKSFPLEN